MDNSRRAPTGDYTGPLRPQVHFSPPKGFMNDPNGCFLDAKGVWHLYYQYNPTDIVAGNQHWGHATSKDLYHWTNQPIALFPPNKETGVFSGCIVIDKDNTSGLFDGLTDGVVAIYTLHTEAEQTQAIAYSQDGGYTFTQYANNPVLSAGEKHFRDPKVIWYEDHWVMVLVRAAEFSVEFYTSPNLLDWTFASKFTHRGLLGMYYECSGLVRMPIRGTTEFAWVVFLSINSEGCVSTGQYFVGDFDGTTFTPYDNAARTADFCRDHYASQWFYGTPDGEEPVSIAWAAYGPYCNDVPTGSEGWRSVMTLPRRNYLAKVDRVGWVMGSEPFDLTPVLGKSLLTRDDLHNDSVNIDYDDTSSGALHFRINISYPDTSLSSSPHTPAQLRFTFSSSKSGESLKGGCFFSGNNAGAFWLDRGGIKGFESPFFMDKFTVVQEGAPFAQTIGAVIDRSVFEVFLDGGKVSGTAVFYPQERLDRLEFETKGLVEGLKVGVEVRALKSAW